jgi:hypothetical protein
MRDRGGFNRAAISTIDMAVLLVAVALVVGVFVGALSIVNH